MSTLSNVSTHFLMLLLHTLLHIHTRLFSRVDKDKENGWTGWTCSFSQGDSGDGTVTVAIGIG